MIFGATEDCLESGTEQEETEDCLENDTEQEETRGMSGRKEASGRVGPGRLWGGKSQIWEVEEEGGGYCDTDTCCCEATC